MTVVTDTTWTPPAGEPRLGLRDLAAMVLSVHDPIAETSRLLDAWAAATDIAALTTVDGTAFWYYGRLRHWMWLQRRLLWLWIVTTALEGGSIERISCGPVDDDLVAVARLVAEAREIHFETDAGVTGRMTGSPPGAVDDASPALETPPTAAEPTPAVHPRPAVRLDDFIRRLRRLGRPAARPSPRVAIRARLDELARASPVDCSSSSNTPTSRSDGIAAPAGSTSMSNSPEFAERLRGSRLDPVAVHITATWERFPLPRRSLGRPGSCRGRPACRGGARGRPDSGGRRHRRSGRGDQRPGHRPRGRPGAGSDRTGRRVSRTPADGSSGAWPASARCSVGFGRRRCSSRTSTTARTG